jgi:putative ABC transport system permease protein
LDCFGEPQGFNELAVVAKNAKDKARAQQIINMVKDKAERSGYTIPLSLVAEPGQVPLDDVLQTIILVLSGLGLFSLLLSAFLIINTFTSMIAQQIRQIGIMKAVGASRAQIMGLYLALVLCFAAVATLISIPLGIIGAEKLSKFMVSYFNFDLTQVDLPTKAISIQLVVGLLVPFLSALYPLLTNLSISAAEAMNAVPMSRTLAKTSRFELIVEGGSLLFNRFFLSCPLIIAFRNTFRSKGRLLLTIATLSFAGAIFTNVFSINASMMRTVDDMLRLYGFDLWITFNKPYRSEVLIQEALQIPNAEKADVWLQFASRRVRPNGTESGLIYIFAPKPRSEIILPRPLPKADGLRRKIAMPL